MSKFTKLLSLLLCLTMLCSAVIACGQVEEKEGKGTDLWADAKYTKDTIVGEGEKTVTVKVEAGGKSIELTVKTDAATLGEALLDYGVIKGDMGDFGIYIKEVNGISADYDTDGYYWGFYQDGEYMMTGVDATNISGGEHFELVRTK